MDLDSLKYPIGEFEYKAPASPEQISSWIEVISSFPKLLKDKVLTLSVNELNWKYRPDGWTINQVVHHCADSHMNSIIRFKLALTEDEPAIKPYFEDKWAKLADYNIEGMSNAVLLITAIHHKWVNLLISLDEEQLERKFYHPESKKQYALKEVIGLYAWHCQHHLAHIDQALSARGEYN